MRILIVLVPILVLAGLALWTLLRADPARLARWLKIAGGCGLIAMGLGLAYARQFAMALPLGVAGWMILRRQAPVRAAEEAGKQSGVSSAGLAMTLDHATGDLDGRILHGEYTDRTLSGLSLPELQELATSFRDDPESLRLLETYLDRAHPGWREDIEADDGQGESTPAGSGGMSLEEAYKILGLEQGAGEAEVRDAHRRLMKAVHPDLGGSVLLAAQINEAKARILGEHR